MKKRLLIALMLLVALASFAGPLSSNAAANTNNSHPAAVSAATSYEVTRGVLDVYGTHNVVYINYDPAYNRLRAHCVSVNNSTVWKYIKSCRLYEYPSGAYRTGTAVGPSKSNLHTYSGLMSRRAGQCYYARMWVTFPGTNNNGYTITTAKCWGG
jgi:hypothetical protein